METGSIKKVGIVGSGRMGESIFYHISNYDFSLVWIFRKEHAKDKAIAKFEKKLKRMHRTGAYDDEIYDKKKQATVITKDMAALNDCDLIIETVVENEEIKSLLFEKLDIGVKKDCIFVSNSSSIKPSRICPNSERKNRFAGLHFFYPVQFNTIVELMTTDVCSAETIEKLRKFTDKIGKKAIVLPEKGAFVLNKAFIYFQVQAFRFYKENILSFEEIDALIRDNIFTMGTFEFMDQVGLDVILYSTKYYMEDMEHKEHIPLVLEEVEKRVKKGHLGIKTGKGFYDYKKENVAEESSDLKIISKEERSLYEEEVINKLKCLYVNSAYDFVDKGYCTESEIETALNEFKGMEKGPVTMGKEIGFGKVYDLLMKYYEQTGEKVFYPSPTLKKRAEMRKE